MSQLQEAEAQRALESDDRREADKELLSVLKADGFTGRRYDRFVEELTRYAVSVLRGWLHSGYIFTLVAELHFGLDPTDLELEELRRDSDLREELAHMTVACALPRFRQRALVEGGWTAEGGASITTYFMGACTYEFPNEWRRHRSYASAYRRSAAAIAAHRVDSASPSVETLVLGNQHVLDHLSHTRQDKSRLAVILTIEGYRQSEIAEILNVATPRSVEGLLRRWRTSAQDMERGDDHE